MNEIEKKMMLGMIDILNQASEAYYSGYPMMTDSQFDMRLADLQELEKETGVIYSNSPSINVGAKILTNLPEVKHNHLMLSLEKCHAPQEIIEFSNGKELVASIKCDGMTVSLLYKNGLLVKGETRGNGHVGNDITEHVKQFLNVPLKIDKDGAYIVDGEAVILDNDFTEINKNNEYKNSRNLIAGTLASLDTSTVSQRKARFIAWDIIEGGSSNNIVDNLAEASALGFDVVPYWNAINLDPKKLQNTLDYIFEYSKDEGIPCDGIVFKFDDIEYGKSLGKTEHHYKNGIAYKAKDKVYKTELLDIEFSIGKTGQLTPTAIFKPVEIDGTVVEKASLSNLSIMEETLGIPFIGEEIFVSKRNAIIPKVESAYKLMFPPSESVIHIPITCPICGGEVEIVTENSSSILRCMNGNCKGKLLGKLTHFVSKNAMDIENLSESTLEKFIELGWLTEFVDIYYLNEHKEEMMNLEGFGEKSVKKLLNSIEMSRSTSLDRFIYALSIPDVGRSTAKTISSRFKNYEDFIMKALNFDWEEIDGIGSQTAEKIDWFICKYIYEIEELARELNFTEANNAVISNALKDKTFCITGSLNHFANRDEAKEAIEAVGGKVSSSISVKTSYLVNNDIASTSSKNKKAKELNIPIISEKDLIEMLKL